MAKFKSLKLSRSAESCVPTPGSPIRLHAQMAGDPVRSVGGGYRWGSRGKTYRGKGAKRRAARQGRAAYASGYKG